MDKLTHDFGSSYGSSWALHFGSTRKPPQRVLRTITSCRAMIAAVLVVLVLALASCVANAQVVYVNGVTGSDANNGSSWGLAKKTVQAGIGAAAEFSEVWVAAATYKEQITLTNFVYVYGGFAGNESARTQRNWNANVTVLDGGGSGTVVTTSAGGTLFGIDGFTVQNGSVGVSCLNSSPSISNNTITGNSSYGISCSSSSATVTNNEILGNGGCGIFCFSSSSGTVMNNAIWGNTGGGIYVYQSSPLIADNTIIGNSAISLPNPGSNSAYCCGGISCSQGRWSIVNNTIVGNSAPSGGGIFICYDYGSTIANNIVAFNSSGLFNYGGGSGPAVLNSNCVYGNTDYDYWSPGAPPGGSANTSVDPLLVDVDGGNFHIQQDSPCRDAGDVAYVGAGWVDMDGQPRISNGSVDIGADESDGTLWPVPNAQVVYVNGVTGSDTNDGSSWGLAKKTVQAGINAAAKFGEVWVAAGTYQKCITLSNFVYVYGGFAGYRDRPGTAKPERERHDTRWRRERDRGGGASGRDAVSG